MRATSSYQIPIELHCFDEAALRIRLRTLGDEHPDTRRTAEALRALAG